MRHRCARYAGSRPGAAHGGGRVAILLLLPYGENKQHEVIFSLVHTNLANRLTHKVVEKAA
jgi:hypothetical protein